MENQFRTGGLGYGEFETGSLKPCGTSSLPSAKHALPSPRIRPLSRPSWRTAPRSHAPLRCPRWSLFAKPWGFDDEAPSLRKVRLRFNPP
jgi:hypothetical protein